MADNKDLRRFLAVLESAGELLRVDRQVDWDGEIAEIQRMSMKRGGPATLFEAVKGHSDTWCRKLFVGGLGTIKRMALMLGLPADAGVSKVVEALAHGFSNPIEPVIVASGPVKTHVYKAEDVDLFQFPAPKWHPDDGGRYINTWCGVVTQDPEGGPFNVGIYRGQILTRNKIGVKLMPQKGWGKHYARYRELGAPMPVAVFYGGDPALGFMSGCPLPVPDEYGIAGALMGEAVKLVKCETNDLMVPADAEIVVEGSISTDAASYEPEGPFGEWTGYYAPVKPNPVLQVDCVTFRDDPILRGTLACTPSTIPRESSVTGYLSACAILRFALQQDGVGGVLDVQTPPRRVPSVAIVKIKREDPDHPLRVAQSLWNTRMTPRPVDTVIVVSGAVDIHGLEPLLNHFSMLNYFGKGYKVTAQGVEDPAAGFDVGPGQGVKILVDATLDPEEDLDEEERIKKELGPPCEAGFTDWRRIVEKRWGDYGFEE
jgi:UbiD family decarboxylase